jgi:hypothetical protein
VLTWPALDDPDFGLGTLFKIDYWSNHPRIFRQGKSGCIYRDTLDIEGGQAQVIPTNMVKDLIPLTQRARQERGNVPLCFDWCLSRAAQYLGWSQHTRLGQPFHTFVHSPSLVNVTEASLTSSLSMDPKREDPNTHYWANNSFDASWKRASKSRAAPSLRRWDP